MDSPILNWRPVPIVGVLITLSILALMGDSARTVLAWDRIAIDQGQWWRLVSGHLVHANSSHLFLNLVAGLLLLAAYGRTLGIRVSLVSLVLISAAIGIGLYIFTDWSTYLGFSGVWHGFFALVLIVRIRRLAQIESVLICLLWAKIIAEQFLGTWDVSSAWIGLPVATEAHLFGSTIGTIIGMVVRRA